MERTTMARPIGGCAADGKVAGGGGVAKVEGGEVSSGNSNAGK